MGTIYEITEQQLALSGKGLVDGCLEIISAAEGRAVEIEELKLVEFNQPLKKLVIEIDADVAKSVTSEFKITFDDLLNSQLPLDQMLVEQYVAQFGNKIQATDIAVRVDMGARVIVARVVVDYIKDNAVGISAVLK